MTQESFFFEANGRRLLGVYFPVTAEAPRRSTAALLFGGFAGEHVICRPHLVAFARLLQAEGIPSLRFDYTGYGDSEGEFTAATMEQMGDDAMAALKQLSRRSARDRFMLLGVRLGATVAAQVAGLRPDVSELVLWEPVPDTWKYIYAELRQTVAMQTLLFRDVKVTRDQIVENVMAGKPSLVDGYDMNCIDDGFALGREFIESVKGVDLVANPPRTRARTLLLHLRERPGRAPKALVALAAALEEQGANCELDVVQQQTAMWKHGRYYMTHSPLVYERTLSWLRDGVVGG
ncbi:MAG: alpha/beta hydrolase [Deltaproteobacteria bacterium]|nr:alpha/beta hydrolase [Deltaproteobacteria bacterium]